MRVNVLYVLHIDTFEARVLKQKIILLNKIKCLVERGATVFSFRLNTCSQKMPCDIEQYHDSGANNLWPPSNDAPNIRKRSGDAYLVHN